MRTEAQVAAMQCPVCRVPLSMSDRQGIEIDYCPQCRGVWLDRGELDKIIDRAGTAPASAPQYVEQPHREPRREPHYDQRSTQRPYKKKRENWLSELFE